MATPSTPARMTDKQLQDQLPTALHQLASAHNRSIAHVTEVIRLLTEQEMKLQTLIDGIDGNQEPTVTFKAKIANAARFYMAQCAEKTQWEDLMALELKGEISGYYNIVERITKSLEGRGISYLPKDGGFDHAAFAHRLKKAKEERVRRKGECDAVLEALREKMETLEV